MLKKIDLSQKLGTSHISILYPGQSLGWKDSGLGSIGRIDQANINGGTTIKMHPHINDEILSYFRTGRVVHHDSAGITETISRKKLMLMKAGRVFYHEEKIIDGLEGLQIFIRPLTADDEPEVLFQDLDDEDSFNAWRLLASNNKNSKFNFTSETEIFDMTLTQGHTLALPPTNLHNAMYILYTFQGILEVNEGITLSKGECLIFDEMRITMSTYSSAEVVLFITNQDQPCFKGGMFSGNKNK